MLFISAFTFFGLSAIQNISYFTTFFGEAKIQLIIETEEENEGANEVKEIKGNQLYQDNDLAIFQYDNLTSTAFHKHQLIKLVDFSEVSTPPPELV